MINLKNLNIILTGATGVIGNSILDNLMSAGANVIATGTNDEKLTKIQDKYKDLNVMKFNMSDHGIIDKFVEDCSKIFSNKISVLINNAGITQDNLSLRMKEEEWKKVIDINLTSTFLITKSVIKKMLKFKNGKIINVTSVVGHTGNIGQANYAASKASAELIINAYEKTYGYKVAMVRPANNYGIYQQPEKLIPFSIAKLESGKNLEVYGDGKNIRHWISVKDTNSAILTVLDRGSMNEIYNIGSDFYLSNIDLVKKIIKFLGKDLDKISYVEDRPGHDFRYATNIDKLKKLGWEPQVDFDEELENICNWYLNNKDWWKEQFKNIIDEKRNKRMGLV